LSSRSALDDAPRLRDTLMPRMTAQSGLTGAVLSEISPGSSSGMSSRHRAFCHPEEWARPENTWISQLVRVARIVPLGRRLIRGLVSRRLTSVLDRARPHGRDPLVPQRRGWLPMAGQLSTWLATPSDHSRFGAPI